MSGCFFLKHGVVSTLGDSMYICMTIHVRTAANYSLNCHVGAMVSRIGSIEHFSL